MSIMAPDLQQTIPCFHFNLSTSTHIYLMYICTNIYIRFTSVVYLRVAETHMHCILYGQKTRNEQFLHFVKSVLTSICGGGTVLCVEM